HFFFQAEDGIRDRNVTGVQTCALPILIKAQDLPNPHERLDLFLSAASALVEAGYVYIGLDHFALPADELNQAQLEGSLQRNFQGYTTRADHDLVGLGVSSIGKVQNTHAQNNRSL